MEAMDLDDISLLLAAPLNNVHVNIPHGAIDLFPRNVGPRILHLPDRDEILKAGPNVRMAEAEAMRFVPRHTSIPVPTVQNSYIEDGCGYIFMSKAAGKPLADVWENLDLDQRALVVSQLRDYVQQLRSLVGDFYGALWHQACEDIFFGHLPFHNEEVHYGPYYSRQEYNNGLATALANSRPNGTLEEAEKDLVKRIQAITDETKHFSHGDLHALNIFADPAGKVTAIIDWGSAGFSICGREYYEARKRSGNDGWDAALDEIFPEDARVNHDLLKEFDLSLTRYTGI